MPKFSYRSHGTVDNWSDGTIEADTPEDAIKKLDEIYGITRDENGNQTNSDVVEVELIK